jgi:polyphosphate glucokinase
MGAMQIVGVDVGGSGIKGALVDTETGELVSERVRIATPQPASPARVAAAVAEVVSACPGDGPVGVGFPAALRHGVALTAANIDSSFIGIDLAGLFGEHCRRPVAVLNDADSAGLAEVTFGAARGRLGVVLVITVGTGLGTALCVDGRVVFNSELGHVEMHGASAEHYASDAARKRLDLSWKMWAGRFDEYLHTLERLLYPELFVVGGGAVKKWDRYGTSFTVETPVVPASCGNLGGMIGAAMHAGSVHSSVR